MVWFGFFITLFLLTNIELAGGEKRGCFCFVFHLGFSGIVCLEKPIWEFLAFSFLFWHFLTIQTDSATSDPLLSFPLLVGESMCLCCFFFMFFPSGFLWNSLFPKQQTNPSRIFSHFPLFSCIFSPSKHHSVSATTETWRFSPVFLSFPSKQKQNPLFSRNLTSIPFFSPSQESQCVHIEKTNAIPGIQGWSFLLPLRQPDRRLLAVRPELGS